VEKTELDVAIFYSDKSIRLYVVIFSLLDYSYCFNDHLSAISSALIIEMSTFQRDYFAYTTYFWLQGVHPGADMMR